MASLAVSSLGERTGAELGWVGETRAGTPSLVRHSGTVVVGGEVSFSTTVLLLVGGRDRQTDCRTTAGSGLTLESLSSSSSSSSPAARSSSSSSSSPSSCSSPSPLSPPCPLSSLLPPSLSKPGSKSISMKSWSGLKDRTAGLIGLETIWSWIRAATPVERLL